MEKISAVIWRIKRIGIVKAKVQNGMVEFKTKTGKKSSIALEYVLLLTDKAITFKAIEKKTIKGEFAFEKGMLTDKKAGIYVSPTLVLMESEVAEQKKNKKDKSEKKNKKDKSEKKNKKDKSEKKNKKNKKDKKNKE